MSLPVALLVAAVCAVVVMAVLRLLSHLTGFLVWGLAAGAAVVALFFTRQGDDLIAWVRDVVSAAYDTIAGLF